VHRIQLDNTVFEGRNNAYLFAGAEPTLLDTGVATAATEEQLRDGLADADAGVGFADVERVILTHYHADHGGLAAAIQAESGAAVHVHEADAAMVAREEAARAEYESLQRRRFAEWGMPPDKRGELEAFLDAGPSLYGGGVDVTPIAAGDGFDVGETTLEAVHAPGHTRGSTAFVTDGGEIYSGDALLPEYTPNVGGADVRVERPLESYLGTLRTFADGGFERALPGHRDPIADPAARAEEIRRHHERRAHRVLSTLGEIGPATPWEVSAALFGALEEIHIIHGPGEAAAHLDHLEREGAIERTDDGYRLPSGTAERLEASADPVWPLDP